MNDELFLAFMSLTGICIFGGFCYMCKTKICNRDEEYLLDKTNDELNLSYGDIYREMEDQR
jgi:hypothetical protein